MYAISSFTPEIKNHDNDDKFTYIYNTYEKKIFRVAYGFIKDFHDAEEAAQSALHAIARNIEKIDLTDEVKTKVYVYKAAKSASYDILRKKKRSPELVSIDSFFNISSGEDLLSDIEKDEKLKHIIQIIESMSDTYKEVLSLYYLESCTVSQISKLLNRPLSTVKSQLQRGGKMLKSKLKEAEIYE